MQGDDDNSPKLVTIMWVKQCHFLPPMTGNALVKIPQRKTW
jgi:hypothetical protein